MNDTNAVIANDVLLNLVGQLREVRKEIKMLEEHAKELKEILIHHMDDNEALINEEGVVVATYKTVGRSGFDTESFKDGYPDLYKMYSKKTEVRTFLIKD